VLEHFIPITILQISELTIAFMAENSNHGGLESCATLNYMRNKKVDKEQLLTEDGLECFVEQDCWLESHHT